MASGLDSVASMFDLNAIRSGFADMGYYLLWGLLGLGVAIFGWLKYQDKKIYIYPTRIFRRRNNGIVKEQNTFGGYIKKNGITFYSVKMGKFKKKMLDKLPLSDLMDEDNRVYYWQLSPDAPLIQVRRDFTIESILAPNDKFVEPTNAQIEKLTAECLKEIKDNVDYKDLSDEEKLHLAKGLISESIEKERNLQIDITVPTYTPVPSDLKQQAMAEINNYRTMLNIDVNKQMAYFVGGLIILGIVAVVLFYIAMNKGDIPILTK
jgi:hypothetical protein